MPALVVKYSLRLIPYLPQDLSTEKPITPPAKVSVDNTHVITGNGTTENNKTVALKKLTEIKPETKVETSAIAPAKPLVKRTTVSKTIPSVIAKPVARSWIARQNPRHFTLQIMGSHERASISKVSHAHKLSPDKAAVLYTRLNNKDWFILVYGSYSTREKARASVGSLPRGLQITKPWPRQIGDIKLVE